MQDKGHYHARIQAKGSGREPITRLFGQLVQRLWSPLQEGQSKTKKESTTTLEPAWPFLCHPVKDKKDCGASADSTADQSVHHYCQSILPSLRIHSDGPDCRHVACNHTANDERDNYRA